jgi:hypothetical protein
VADALVVTSMQQLRSAGLAGTSDREHLVFAANTDPRRAEKPDTSSTDFRNDSASDAGSLSATIPNQQIR